MGIYNFFYDESRHDPRLTYKTITSNNYQDAFVSAIVGWDSDYNDEISRRWEQFRQKHNQNFDKKNELKSKILDTNQFRNGFHSLHGANILLLQDFFEIFDEKVMLRISITSKFEMLITQLFKQYNDSVAIDYSKGTIISTKMDAFKYSIIKSIRDYRPQEILSAIHSNPQRIPSLLVEFYRKKISQNERNMNLILKPN